MIQLFQIKNFPNEIIADIFSVLFIIILLIELRILLRYKADKEDKNSMLIVILGIFLSLVIAILLSYTKIGGINTNISYLGIIILISGFILRQYSIKTLGKFFKPVITKQKNQRLITSGIYKYIRHPSYTGLLMELSGTALALSNIISFILTLTIFIPAISYRIKIEESFLEKNFKDYEQYKKTTKKLIPFIY